MSSRSEMGAKPPSGVSLNKEELGLDAEVEGVAQRRSGFGLALEDAARASVEGLAVQVEVTGEPGEIAVPAALGGGRRVASATSLSLISCGTPSSAAPV